MISKEYSVNSKLVIIVLVLSLLTYPEAKLGFTSFIDFNPENAQVI